MNIEALARPDILGMRPYASARGTMSADGILLNANEAPLSLVEQPCGGGLSLNRYPPPQPEQLVSRLSQIYGVEEDQLLITRGSDEGIDLLTRVFCRPDLDAIVECPPCFGMYRVAAAIQGARVISVWRDSASLLIDHDRLETTIRENPNAKLVFLTSPNNPTGDIISAAELQRILEACGETRLLVLDEAYVEFCTGASAAELVQNQPGLVVLRTLSKAWASAGLRCGSVIASPTVIGLLKRVMAPYPLSTPAIEAALAATEPKIQERQGQMIRSVLARKRVLLDQLDRHDWVRSAWPGEANFVLLRVADAPALVAHCGARNIRIRGFDGQPGLEGCVRLTIGTEEEMAALADALDSFGVAP